MKKIYVLAAVLAASLLVTGCRVTVIPSMGQIVQADNIEIISEDRDDTDSMESPTLAEVFAEHNMGVGTCLSPQMISNPIAERLILENFNSITMENAMKPDYILNKAKSIKSGDIVVEMNQDVVKMLDWAKANDIAVRGHTLIWYSQTPDWIFYENFNPSGNMVSREVMLARMESYIRQVFEWISDNGYADIFYAYDVVNEAWMENGNIRECNWLTTIGDDYLWYAFSYADKYAPENIDLYYNDYNEQYKSRTLGKFVSTLVDENGRSLIDGIGLQAHLYTNDNLKSYLRTVDELSATGLKLEITELDVALGSWQNTLAADEENLKAQGDFYYDLINGIFERVDNGSLNMDTLTFWGFCDSMSWRSEAHPLLFDASFKPKDAFYGVIQKR